MTPLIPIRITVVLEVTMQPAKNAASFSLVSTLYLCTAISPFGHTLRREFSGATAAEQTRLFELAARHYGQSVSVVEVVS